ncbi:unnamed protein product [Arabis nemorensis]|uniref:BAG domain-containing protein n=1 Tax=Arabis nemorensis TaxID=586526 RepID=A0A565CJN5_9BRAS|nr:unnamed protein product [Arabis nemorensis]
MMPVYNDSSQPCHMRPQGYYHQAFGNNQPQHMTMEAPSPCHGSCVHGNFPAYNAYWPPCYPPQVPYHPYCVNHPGIHPHASYAPPCYIHPPFPAGYQPWYGSEKDVPVEHRCGKCSPQMCYPKNETGVVIEEHEPENEKGSRGEAVFHVRSTNGPYPTIWIPHDNARNQEHGSSSVGSGNHEKPPAECKAPENMTVQKFFPNPWNGCFPFDESTMKSLVQNQDRKKAQNGKTIELPFDLSKLKSLLQGQDTKEEQIQKNKGEQGQLPYPIFRIPSHGKQENVEASESKESSNEGRNLKSFPSDLYGNEGRKPQAVPSVLHGNAGPKTQNEGKEGNFECSLLPDAEKKISLRSIPVENQLQEPRTIPVKLSESHLPKPTEPTKTIVKKTEPIGNTKREQPPSPPKASRLPPVCLRVDPLPKRKHSGAKSLNSPRRKEQPLKAEETKVISPLSSKKAETKSAHEACDVKCEEPNKEKMSEEPVNSTGTEKESVESNSNLQGGANWEIVKSCETKENREKPAKKTFTEEEAARFIQSRYRGYDVRRWEPIKKLKEIATVREQMGDIKKRIQALDVSTDQRIEEKETVILGEMVMNLLLKLDSVQGLHPGIRDHRKSLVRELSDIQEKLDSMKSSSAIAEKEKAEEQVEITSETSDFPVNLEHTQLAEENKMVPETNTEEVRLPSPEEHPPSVLNRTEAQPVAEAEEGSGLFKTLVTDPEPATESSTCEAAATSTTVPEKIGEVEFVQPVNPLSADGEEVTVTNIEEDNAVVKSLEEPQNELPQVVESSTSGPENVTVVSETEGSVLENVERKAEDDTILPSEEYVEFSEVLPVGVTDDEMQVLSQDSSSCTREAEMTAMDLETAIREETNIDLSSDHSKELLLAQETISEPQEETKQPPETEVTEREIPEETKKLMEENQRFKETMDTLVKAGKEQLEAISKLTGRVKSLEKKLSQKKRRTQIGHRKPNRVKDATIPMSASSTDVVL